MKTKLRHCMKHAEYDDACHDCYSLQYGCWRHCDCITSGNAEKPKQHGADDHAKNCAIYQRRNE